MKIQEIISIKKYQKQAVLIVVKYIQKSIRNIKSSLRKRKNQSKSNALNANRISNCQLNKHLKNNLRNKIIVVLETKDIQEIWV